MAPSEVKINLPSHSGGGTQHPTNQNTDLLERLFGRHQAVGVVPVGHAVALAEQCQGGRVRYCGNPVHKRNPGDFGLTPPAGPRPGKSLCDTAKIFDKAVANKLLQKGVARGLVSKQFQGDWPQKGALGRLKSHKTTMKQCPGAYGKGIR